MQCFQLHLDAGQPPSRLVDDEHFFSVLKGGSGDEDDEDDGDSDGDNQKEKASHSRERAMTTCGDVTQQRR